MFRWLPVVLAAVALCGCADEGDVSSARTTALWFTSALGSEDATSACAVLAAETSKRLQVTGDSCESGLLARHVPSGSSVVKVDVFGDRARVVLDTDTLFLARAGDTWTVTAAGCTDQGTGLPYDCTVSGADVRALFVIYTVGIAAGLAFCFTVGVMQR